MSWKRIFFDNPLALLDQFTEYVEEERANKLPYATWRNIKSFFLRADMDNCQVGIEYDGDGNILMGFSKRDVGNYDPLIVEGIQVCDNSFGSFIANILDGYDVPWKNSKPLFIGDDLVDIKGYSIVDPSAVATPKADKGSLIVDGDLVVKGKIINENKERESNNMKFNFDFGSCEKDNVKVSPYGIAVQNATGTWVSYDTRSGNIVDVDIFNFNGGKYLFKMPVALKDVKPGDTVIHNRTPVFVVAVEGGDITVVDPRAGDKKTILPVTNMFGFNFIVKVVCLFDGAFNSPTTDNPFGNMLPFFLMSNSDKNNDIDPLMMAMLLNGSMAVGGLQNPMMLALLCGDQTNMREVLPLMMLADQNSTPFTPPAK
jgi:hypothetical protein